MFLRFPETNRAAVAYSDQPPRGQKRGRIIKRKHRPRKDSGRWIGGKSILLRHLGRPNGRKRLRVLCNAREIAVIEESDGALAFHQHASAVVRKHGRGAEFAP